MSAPAQSRAGATLGYPRPATTQEETSTSIRTTTNTRTRISTSTSSGTEGLPRPDPSRRDTEPAELAGARGWSPRRPAARAGPQLALGEGARAGARADPPSPPSPLALGDEKPPTSSQASGSRRCSGIGRGGTAASTVSLGTTRPAWATAGASPWRPPTLAEACGGLRDSFAWTSASAKAASPWCFGAARASASSRPGRRCPIT